MFKKFSQLTEYQKGIRIGNWLLHLRKKEGYKPDQLRRYADEEHDKADAEQYRIRAEKGAKASDRARGKAMALGMFAHTGIRINERRFYRHSKKKPSRALVMVNGETGNPYFSVYDAKKDGH